MRLALLSALADPRGTSGANTGSQGHERPAFRRFAGKSVLAHQLDCAAHLACERVLCLASGAGPDLSAARAHAERAGLRFDVIDSIPRIQALVTADDDVVLIDDGVLPDQAVLIESLSERSVLAFPAEPALELGFERLDATRSWSGALRTRGESIARLADLPPDCDLGSTLLRIALQAGARVIELDPAPLVEGTWQRRVDPNAGQATEWRWITRQVRPASFAAPGRALVERIGLRWAHDAIGGRWSQAPHLLALASGTLSAFAGIAGIPVLGLALLLAAWCALAIAHIFTRVQALGAPPRKPRPTLAIARLACDCLMVGLVSMQVMTVPGWLGIVLPIVLLGVLWIGETTAAPSLRPLFGDRIVLVAALVPISYFGWNTLAIAALIVVGLAALLWSALVPPKQITAD